MIRSIFYGLLFLLTLLIQTGMVASLPDPYRSLPLPLILGVIVLHERSLLLGAFWIALSGILLETRGLGIGVGFASIVAATAAVGLAVSVFAKRSFWAMLGIGGGSAVAYVLARMLWLFVLTLFVEIQINVGDVARQGLSVIFLALVGVFVFGAYIRRFLRWSRDKFVSKGGQYDVSFPQ